MLEIKNKADCCGCEACKNICPQKCITMKEDEEGFRYPIIDKEKCINCNLCEKVCPLKKEIQNKDLLKKTEFLAAYNKDDEILKKSSSGGIFWLLAEWIFENNGIVYGVIQEDTYNVKFSRAENKNEAEKIRGSKYLQAEVNDIYSLVKADLENSKLVLFSGTPCQVAALYKFLNKEYSNLYTVDVVCHGVPSNAVYRKYIEFMEKQNNKKVTNIKWRDKVNGWGPNRITLYFDDNTTKTTISRENPFQIGFLDNVYLRPSCYECKYAKLPRIADISLADFWGYDKELLKNNNNKGLSIIVVSSNKGNTLLKNIEKNIIYHEVEEEYVKSKSRHVYIHPIKNKRRTNFFEDFNKMSFDNLAKKYMKKTSVIKKIKISIKKIVKKVIKK